MKQSKRHILFLASWYPSRVLPLNGDFIQRHAEAVALLHQVTVFHVITDPNAKKNIEIVTENHLGVNTYIAYIKPSFFSVVKFLRFIYAYYLLFKTVDNFDLIHVHRIYPAGLIALGLKIFKQKKYIVTEHWTGFHTPRASMKKMELFLARMIAKHASFLAPVSNDLGRHMLRAGLKGHYLSVPNVVNTDIFIPKNNRVEGLSIIHISSLYDPTKNVTGLLHVLNKMQENKIDFTAKIIGSHAVQHAVYQKVIDKHAAAVTFYPHLSHTEMIEHLQEASVMVLFSRVENLPCVILESFAVGVPVITTDVGGIKEYFPAGFGTLIGSEDELALYESLKAFSIQNWSSPTEMHKYAHREFSPMAVARKFNGLYQKML